MSPGSHDAAGATRVSATRFDTSDKTARPLDPARLDEELAGDGSFCWIDVEGTDETVLGDLLARLGIDLAVAAHFGEPEILPRMVEREDFLSFHLHEVADPESHLDTSRGLNALQAERLLLVSGARFVLTYHRVPLAAVEHVRARCAESFRLHGKSPGFVAFLFLDRCLHDHAHLNLANDNYLDHLEEQVLAGDPIRLSESVSIAARNILLLKKLTASLHVVLMALSTKRSAFVTDEGRSFYHEMLQNAVAVRAAIDSSRDLLDGVVASLQARSAQRTSDIARLLTVVSTIVLPLTLVAGIYGMNFDHFPGLRWRAGYHVTLAAMGVIAVVLLGCFWRLGWLGRSAQQERPRPRRKHEP